MTWQRADVFPLSAADAVPPEGPQLAQQVRCPSAPRSPFSTKILETAQKELARKPDDVAAYVGCDPCPKPNPKPKPQNRPQDKDAQPMRLQCQQRNT